MTTPKHDAETSTFTRVADAEKTSNQDPREVCVEVATVPQNPEKSLASQSRRRWNPVKSNGFMVPCLKHWNDDQISKKNSVKLTRPGLCPDQVK